ncbi:MAG TPA: hypothetical protein VGT61_00840 [Thermomicrobiales bacterium]|jgi:hypothetical protein|nr:hypothetical protein [Thermomicrobiales bacterium]
MTYDDDPRRDRTSPVDDWQSGLLDRYLDDLAAARGNQPPPALDRTLSNVADLIIDRNVIHEAPAQPSRKARTWAALMEPATPARPGSATMQGVPSLAARRAGTLQPVSSPTHRPTPLRRSGSRAMGMVATLTLVLLVGLSGVAVWLTAPHPEPTTIALFGERGDGTPTPLPTHAWSIYPNDIPPTIAVPAQDILMSNLVPCDVQPRDRDQILLLIGPYLTGEVEPPPSALAMGRSWLATPTAEMPYPPLALPVGERPDAATIEQITDLWAIWLGCQQFEEVRRAASLVTDDGLIRYYLRDQEIASQLPSSTVSRLDLLDREPGAAGAIPRVSRPAQIALIGLRMLDADHAVALVSGYLLESPPTSTGQAGGYVIFERTNGNWLIDDLPAQLSCCGWHATISHLLYCASLTIPVPCPDTSPRPGMAPLALSGPVPSEERDDAARDDDCPEPVHRHPLPAARPRLASEG